ncbi:unnamed protein product [Rotaria sordida]|uniref:AB hydrolase-1 domain-containing protein n=1 Tax=Rotaria sordida TaxID=392033 RepID=A0A814FED2_9BILA|nr:unnamed protein product [Rotaria sordida]
MSIKKDYFSLTSNIKIYYELRCSSPSSSSSNLSTKILMIMGACATLRHFDEFVEYLIEHYPSSIEILTYDHRGIGHSKTTPTTTTVTIERQTTTLLAHDAYQLINHVWGGQAPVHVLGVSLGGMVAQELAVLLIPEQRLLSLYLEVTTRGAFRTLFRNIELIFENNDLMPIYLGSYIRPLALLPRWVFSRIILPYFVIKSDNEQMVRSLVSLVFNEIEEEEKEELIKKWLNDYDKWFIFQDFDGMSQHNVSVCSHYLTDEHAQQIKDAQVPVTVHIAMQDKLIPPKKQQELANLLNAKTVVMEHSGHMFTKQQGLRVFEGVLQHIQDATA